MNNSKNRVANFFLHTIFILFLTTNLYAKEKVTLQLNWLNQFQFAGYYVAKEKGFYKNLGLEVDIKEASKNISPMQLILDKKVDFAVGRSSIIIEKSKGKDIKALFAAFQTSPLMLLVSKVEEIKTIQELKNKKVMITGDAVESASLLAMLSSQGIKSEDINIQKHSFNLDDLVFDKTDAMAAYLSNEPIRLKDKNIPYNIFHPSDYGFDFYSDILYTSNELVKVKPNVVKNFYKASLMGWEYAFKNIGRTAEIIFKKYNTQNKSLIQLVEEGEILKQLAYKDDIKFGDIDDNKIQNMIHVYKLLGVMSEKIDIEEFIYNHEGHNHSKIVLSGVDIFTISIVSLFLFVFFVFITLYVMIKKRMVHTHKMLKDEINKKTEKLKEQTYIDYLTKAKNRKAFSETLLSLIRIYKQNDTTFSIIIFDIDDFKNINDSYGHDFGDKVLINMTNIVQNLIRSSDTVFRIGGEEFVVLLPGATIDSSFKISKKLLKEIPKQLLEKMEKSVTVSIGITEVNKDDNETTIFKRVDKLLYKAKDLGKNRIIKD